MFMNSHARLWLCMFLLAYGYAFSCSPIAYAIHARTLLGEGALARVQTFELKHAWVH
jgi:hypothetical protein